MVHGVEGQRSLRGQLLLLFSHCSSSSSSTTTSTVTCALGSLPFLSPLWFSEWGLPAWWAGAASGDSGKREDHTTASGGTTGRTGDGAVGEEAIETFTSGFIYAFRCLWGHQGMAEEAVGRLSRSVSSAAGLGCWAEGLTLTEAGHMPSTVPRREGWRAGIRAGPQPRGISGPGGEREDRMMAGTLKL